MNATQAENLRILVRHMETNVTRVLNMDKSFDCGTPACAAGEACLLPQFAKIKGELYDVACSGQIVGSPFGEYLEVRHLFADRGGNHWRRTKVTPQEWALEARRVLAENGYSMDEAKPIPSVTERLEAIYAAPLNEKPEQYGPRVFRRFVMEPNPSGGFTQKYID